VADPAYWPDPRGLGRDLRYFAGLPVPEAAKALGVAPRTADRLGRFARAGLPREVGGAAPDGQSPPEKKRGVISPEKADCSMGGRLAPLRIGFTEGVVMPWNKLYLMKLQCDWIVNSSASAYRKYHNLPKDRCFVPHDESTKRDHNWTMLGAGSLKGLTKDDKLMIVAHGNLIYRRRSGTASSLLRTYSIPGHALNVTRLIIERLDE
jgi:hypothetical protein